MVKLHFIIFDYISNEKGLFLQKRWREFVREYLTICLWKMTANNCERHFWDFFVLFLDICLHTNLLHAIKLFVSTLLHISSFILIHLICIHLNLLYKPLKVLWLILQLISIFMFVYTFVTYNTLVVLFVSTSKSWHYSYRQSTQTENFLCVIYRKIYRTYRTDCP